MMISASRGSWQLEVVGYVITSCQAGTEDVDLDAMQEQRMTRNAVPGSMGTSAGLVLRLGQAIFSSASLLFMSLGVEFYSYTAFW